MQGTASLSKEFLLTPSRGIYLPPEYGFEEDEDFDKFGRPRWVNPLTVANYLQQDILAADRYFQPETNRLYTPFSFQRIILREMLLRQFLFIQIMRGGSKSTSIGRFILTYAMIVPGTKIALTAPTYRQSLFVFDEIANLIEANKQNKNCAFNIGNEIDGPIKRGTMEASVKFKNRSWIKSMPMGRGEGVRGLRAGLIFVDEAYQLTSELWESHLAPIAGVKQGGRESKIIMASTSWYQDCFMYKKMMQIAEEMKRGNPDYGILDFNLDDLREFDLVPVLEGDKYVPVRKQFPLSEGIYKDARKNYDPTTYAMTYYNLWPDTVARWYGQMYIDSSISMKNGVQVELKRPEGCRDKYFGVMDLAASEKGDSCGILIGKFHDGKAKYVWGRKAKGWDSHRRVWEAHQAIKKFGLEFFIYDAHGAIGASFRQDAERSTLSFKNDKGQNQVEEVEPLLHWDVLNKKGNPMLIPVSLKDEAVIEALTGDPHGSIEGEDGFTNLLHTKTRELLWDGKILGPGADYAPEESAENASSQEYDGSPQDALDVIREAFMQLGKISLLKDVNNEQKTTMRRNLIFKKKPGASVDDGAFCIIYGSIGLLKLLGPEKTGRTPAERRVVFQTTADVMLKNQDPNDFGRIQKIRFA